jgi:hypothetical protein
MVLNGPQQGRREPANKTRTTSQATENEVEGMFSVPFAEVAELADALDSGSSARKGVRVQIPASAPPYIPNLPVS